jgi:hypothetical protein
VAALGMLNVPLTSTIVGPNPTDSCTASQDRRLACAVVACITTLGSVSDT